MFASTAIRATTASRAAGLIGLVVSAAIAVGCGSKGAASTAATTTTTTATTTRTATTPSTTTATPAGGVSREVSPTEVRASAGTLTATLRAAGRHPRVGRPWPIGFTVLAAGRPARATVAYEYLFGGAVVAHRSHYMFTGAFHDTFQWPASAVGYPLTFRAVITSAGKTLNLDYPVQVVR